MSDLFKRLSAEIEKIPIIDTHEHLMSETMRLSQDIDLFYWFSHYASSDLVSAGMSQAMLEQLWDSTQSLDDRWAMFEPFWKLTRTTAYGRVLLIAARDLFGIEDINASTYQELSDKIKGSNAKGWYERVLKGKANISISILQPKSEDPVPLADHDRRFFAPVFGIDDLITPCNREALATLECTTGMAIHALDDLIKVMDFSLTSAIKAKIYALKVALAYQRPLCFENVPRADADRIFNRLMRYPASQDGLNYQPPLSWEEARPLQDFLMHQAIQRAIEHDLPIQIHTGIQEGNGNFLENAHPLHLTNLFVQYPSARFDLFHAGYPFQSEMAVLGKNFPNVFVDMCWLHAISPWVARQTLHEWIETVPANKIFAFGGDYIFVEGAYAHSRIARRNVAEVLTEKVESNYLSEFEALEIAQMIFYDNPKQFFNLSL
jgi:hypothetical protein